MASSQNYAITGANIVYVIALALTALFWDAQSPTPFIIAAGVSLVLKVTVDSLTEGELYWPDTKAFDKYRTLRIDGHLLIVIGIVLSCIFFLIGEWRDEWNRRSVPHAWRIVLISTSAVYALTSVPAVMALTNSKLWSDKTDLDKDPRRRISIVVVKEIITVGFAIPLILNLPDIINDGNDTEWRHLAASLVFTRAVVHFIIFWYVNKWDDENPLHNDDTVSSICKGVGMLILYIIVIRRLHENKLLTSMQFVGTEDNVAAVGAFLSLLAAYLIQLKNADGMPQIFKSILSTSGIIFVLVLVLVIMLIGINA